MTTSNIKLFNELTGRVLGALYEGFPVPRQLFIKNFIDGGYSEDPHLGAEVPNDKGTFFLACVDWLADAGYLRFGEKNHHFGFMDAVLTAKGLEVLKASPESLKTDQSLGDQLVDASKEVAKDTAKEVLRGTAGQVLAIGARFLATPFGFSG